MKEVVKFAVVWKFKLHLHIPDCVLLILKLLNICIIKDYFEFKFILLKSNYPAVLRAVYKFERVDPICVIPSFG